MTFERTCDYRLVLAIVTEPRIYRAAADDFTPPAEQYTVNESEAIWYVLVRDGGELLGLFAFVAQSRICYEVHCCLLPCARGRAAAALRSAIAWMFEHSEARRIVGSTPAYLRLALKMAADAGLRQYGVNSQSFLRHGKLHDQILMGISKGPA